MLVLFLSCSNRIISRSDIVMSYSDHVLYCSDNLIACSHILTLVGFLNFCILQEYRDSTAD